MPDLLDSPISADEDAVSAAEAFVRSYCRWHIAPTVDEVVTVDGSGTPLLMLPTLHVTAIASVVEDGTALSVDDFEWSSVGVLKRAGRSWTSKWRGVVVTFSHGYQACPPDLAQVVTRLASSGIAGSSGGSVRVGDVSVSAASSGLDAAGGTVLDAYRIVV